MFKGFLNWLFPAIFRFFGVNTAPKRQPDAEGQDQRATAVDQAARADQRLQDQQAAVAASGDSNATVTKAADAAAAVQRDSVSNPPSIDSNPAGHWRTD